MPAKQGTEKEREKRRAETLKRAKELSAQGRESDARQLYVKCVDITPQMAFQVIKVYFLLVITPYVLIVFGRR